MKIEFEVVETSKQIALDEEIKAYVLPTFIKPLLMLSRIISNPVD